MEIFNDLVSDDDEDILEFFYHERRPYNLKERPNYFDQLNDVDFATRFRLKKDTVVHILDLIEDQIETPTDRNNALSPIKQLLLTLRFYATGSFLNTIGDFLNVSKSTACNVIKKVTRAIASLAPQCIKMPSTENEIVALHLKFYDIARFPRVIGSIDCTHIKIQSPGGDNAEVFRNEKGYFSIKVQTVSSANLKILDLVARWPGSTHDQIIFDNSSINQRIHANEFGNSLLVGDSGYADTSHVVTPIDVAHNDVEQLYNESVRLTRNPVEESFGIWKRRFPLLSLGLRLKLDNSLAVIVACGVLHNIAIERNEELPPDDPNISQDIDFDEDFEIEPLLRNNLNNAKDELLAEYFPKLVEGI